MAADNNGITAARLRSDVDYLLGVIRRTQPLWDTGRWPSPGPVPQPKNDVVPPPAAAAEKP